MSVGLVIVSHSARIAEGVVELARQMAPTVALEAAGGTDEGGIGTSFTKVQEALAAADSGAGAVVLCDLGSAVLTAETALDFTEAAERIRIADAPIVEGAVAAAVAAEAGGDLAHVVAAAEQQASAPEAVGAAAPTEADQRQRDSGEVVLDLTLSHPHGLHARPAAALVRTAGAFDATVTVNGVDATSMLRVIALGLGQGAIARFAASGAQAEAAIAAIAELAERDFGDERTTC